MPLGQQSHNQNIRLDWKLSRKKSWHLLFRIYLNFRLTTAHVLLAVLQFLLAVGYL